MNEPANPRESQKGALPTESHAVDILVAALATILAFALCLAALTQRSIWADELSTLAMFPTRDLRSLVQQIAESERRPPLYFILVWSWSKVGGTNEFALRYFSLAFTTLAIAIWFALARSLRRLFGVPQRAFVWVALALGVIAPDLALYGVMLRYYSFLLCLSLALNLIFVRWLVSQGSSGHPAAEQHGNSTGTWAVACWLGAALMLAYTDYSVAALIFAQVLWLGVRARSLGRKLRPWGIALGVLFIAYLPLFASLRTQVGRDGLHADLSQSPVGVALNLLYPIFSYTFGETILPWHLLVVAAIPFVGLVFAGLLRNLRNQPMVRFGMLLIGLPIIFNAVIQTTVATDLTFLTMASRTWFVLPVFVMLVALGIVGLPMRIRLLGTSLLLLANGAALGNMFGREQFHNPIFAVPLREVAASLRSESRPGDVLLADVDIGFQYYWQPQPPAGTRYFQSEDWPAPQSAVETAQAPRIWFITFGRDRTRLGDHAAEIRSWLAPHYEQVADRKYVPIDGVYRAVKQWLLRRETYDAKLTVQGYERVR